VKHPASSPQQNSAASAPMNWDLRLYAAGRLPKSVAAVRNDKKLGAEHYHIEVIDLLKNPQLAQGDQILAVPTLVWKLPSPVRKIIGNLSDTGRLLVGFDLRSRDADQWTIGKGKKHGE
jgi:circadian clock protein KaiB